MWTFATRNPHKLAEVQALLGAAFPLRALPAEIPAAPEPHTTLYENALAKARFYAEWGVLPLLVEDSGLYVPALGGQPGADAAHYGGPERLLQAMQEISRREAYFVAVVLAYEGPQSYRFFTGVWWGEIARKAAGSEGFGYDPVFVPAGATRTVAELGLSFKLQLSHRTRAFQKFLAWMTNQTPSDTLQLGL